jgi:hypothetical protein
MMLLAVLLAGTLFVAAAAGPALAQTSGNPPDYVLGEDGTVVIDGDVATDCPSFASALEEGYELAGNPEQAQAVLEQCRQAGLLPSDASAPAPPAPPSAQVAQQRQRPSPAPAALPNTGGPGLLVPAAAGSALLVGAAALGLAASRRRSP